MAGFDATGGRSQGGSENNLLFGAIALVGMGVIFTFGIFGPFGSKTAPKERAIAEIVAGLDEKEAFRALQAEAFGDEATGRFLRKLAAVDAKSYTKFYRNVTTKALAGAERDAFSQDLMTLGQSFVERNAHYVSQSDVRHFDRMVVFLRQGISDVQASHLAGYCKGDAIESMGVSATEVNDLSAQMEQFIGYKQPLYNYSMEFNLIMLDAIEDGKASPADYGELDQTDTAALQGLVFGMMSDPSVQKLMTAAMAGGSPDLSDVDFCTLADTALEQVQGLPLQTRARLWTTGIGKAATGDVGDLAALAG